MFWCIKREQNIKGDFCKRATFCIVAHGLPPYYGYCNKYITNRNIRQADSGKLFNGSVKEERSATADGGALPRQALPQQDHIKTRKSLRSEVPDGQEIFKN